MQLSHAAKKKEIVLKGIEVRASRVESDVNVAYVNGRFCTYKARELPHAMIRVIVKQSRKALRRTYEAQEALAVCVK